MLSKVLAVVLTSASVLTIASSSNAATFYCPDKVGQVLFKIDIYPDGTHSCKYKSAKAKTKANQKLELQKDFSEFNPDPSEPPSTTGGTGTR